jgi:hypothetical protein
MDWQMGMPHPLKGKDLRRCEGPTSVSCVMTR